MQHQQKNNSFPFGLFFPIPDREKKQKSWYMYILEVIRVYTAKTPTKMANKKLLTTTVKSKLKIYRS